MVWIYGGGFQAGSASEPRQDGENLAKKGVIVVSMNYRLGVFGFMAHPDLTKESGHSASGNYGLMDQAAALEFSATFEQQRPLPCSQRVRSQRCSNYRVGG